MPRSRRARRVLGWGGATATLAAVAGVWLWSTAAASSTPASTPASIACSSTAVVFGEELACSVSGPDQASIVWSDDRLDIPPDGRVSLDFRAVGGVTVGVEAADGTVLASTAVTVTPDVGIVCTDGPERLPVYELAASAGLEPWGYVYLDEAGARIEPDHERHHEAGLGNFDRVQLGSEYRTSNCQPESAALDELGGSVSWWVDSEFYEPYEVPVRSIAPTSKGHWDGLQPGVMVATVNVGGVEASERVGVFFSGCT